MTLHLNLLGGFALEAGGVPMSPPARKARAMLAALALARHRSLPRARLASMLWEASDPELARTSLRQALAQLRRIGIDLSGADPDTLTLATDIPVDVDGFVAAVAQGDSAGAVRLYRGDLMEGQAFRDPAVEEWLRGERARLRDMAIQALQSELDRIGDRAEAEAVAHRLLALDPLREAGHRAIMRLESARGHPSAAVARFHALRDLLRRELDTAPEAETVALFDALRAGRASRPAAPDASDKAEAVAAPAADSHIRQVLVLVALETGEQALAPDWDAEMALGIEAAGGTVARRETGQLIAVWGLERTRADAADQAAALARRTGAEIGKAVSFGLLDAAVMTGAAGGGLGRIFQRALRLAASAELGGLAIDPRLAARLDGATDDAGQAVPVPPFVGRDPEVAQITGAFQGALAAGTGLVAHVCGEAGIGKTRLAREIAERLSQRGVGVVTIGFEAFGVGTLHIGERIARALPDAAQPEVADAFDRAVIGALLGTAPDTGDTLRLTALTPDERMARDVAMTRRLLAAAAQQNGLLLVIEDCHWASHAAAGFLLDVSDEANRSPVVFLFTERPGDDTLAPRLATRGRVPLSRLQLAPLAASAAEALAGSRNVPEDRAQRALAHAGGHPLFLLRLLESDWTGDALPPSISALVQEQIERLDPDKRTALRKAAIFGRRVDTEAFAAVFGIAPPPPTGDLLVRDGTTLLFGHDLVHRAVYESLPGDLRQTCHAQAAAHFRDRDPLAWADHALLATDDGDACRAAAAAANAMIARRRFRSAAPYIDAALARGGDAEAIAEIHSCRAGIRRIRGDLNGALEDYRAAYSNAVLHPTQVAMLVRMALVLHRLGRGDEADTALDDAEAIADRAGLGGIARAEIHEQRGNRAFVQGNLDACARHNAAALTLCEPTGDLRHIARAYGGLGDAAYAAGRMYTAYAHFDRAISLAQEGGHGIVVEEFGFMRAFALYFADPGPKAMVLMDLVIESALASGARRSEMIAREARATMRISALDLTGAAEDIARALKLHAAEPEARFHDDLMATQALLAHRQGDLELAERLGWRGIEGAADRPYSGGYQFGIAALVLRDPGDRRRAIDAGMRFVQGPSIAHGVMFFHRFALETALQLGERDIARDQIAALRSQTSSEPLGWAELVAENGDLALSPDPMRFAAHKAKVERHLMHDLIIKGG